MGHHPRGWTSDVLCRKILEAREHRRLISLSSVADGGEEALLKNPLFLALSALRWRGEGIAAFEDG